jgi:hypothetical protein
MNEKNQGKKEIEWALMEARRAIRKILERDYNVRVD